MSKVRRSVVAAERPDVGRAHDATGRTGEHAASGVGDGVVYRHHPAGGLHDQGRRHAGLLGLLGQVREVRGEPRSQVGVGGGRGEPLVLPELRQHLAAEGDVQVGQRLAQRFADPLFVLGVHEREEQAHGDGLDLRLFDGGDGLSSGSSSSRGEHLAVRSHPLLDGEAQPARDEGRRAVLGQVVEGGAVLAGYLQHVPEALGGDEGRAGAAALQQGVGRHGHPVGEGDARRRPRPRRSRWRSSRPRTGPVGSRGPWR